MEDIKDLLQIINHNFFFVLWCYWNYYIIRYTSFAMPGDSLNINVVLVNKVPLSKGLRFVMREGNLTIGAV